MFYVYVLFSSKTSKMYKGYSSDLRKRLRQHNDGQVKSTSRGLPWELIYYEAFVDKSDALREELYLKSGKGRDRLKYLFQGMLRRKSIRPGEVA